MPGFGTQTSFFFKVFLQIHITLQLGAQLTPESSQVMTKSLGGGGSQGQESRQSVTAVVLLLFPFNEILTDFKGIVKSFICLIPGNK